MKIKQDRYNYSGRPEIITHHDYFCDQTCLMDFVRTHLTSIVAIAPCTEPKETPINDPYKDPDRYHFWTFEKKEVDNNSNMG